MTQRQAGGWRTLATLALMGLLAPVAIAGGLRLDTQDSAAPPPAGERASAGLPDAAAWTLDAVLGGCDAAVSAVPRWTLDAVVRAVICHAPSVRRADGLVTQARGVDRAGRANWQPALSLVGGLDAQQGYGSDTSAVVQLDWILFDFGQRSAARREAASGLAASLDEQRVEVLTAVAQAAQLYTATQAAQGRLDALSSALRQAEVGRQLAEARREAGAASLAERHRADTAVAQARAEHARALEQWLITRGALAVAMGLAPQAALSLEDLPGSEPTADAAPDLPSLLDEAQQRHPQILAARQRVAEAQARWDSTRAARWGEVGLTVQSGRARSTNDLQVRTITRGALDWTVPLLDREQSSSQREQALGQWRVREAGLAEAQAQVAATVWEQGRLLQGEQVALRESLKARDSADAAWRVTTERYRLGVGSFGDVLSAQAASASALLQVADAQAAWQRARWRLAAAVGRLGPLRLD